MGHGSPSLHKQSPHRSLDERAHPDGQWQPEIAPGKRTLTSQLSSSFASFSSPRASASSAASTASTAATAAPAKHQPAPAKPKIDPFGLHLVGGAIGPDEEVDAEPGLDSAVESSVEAADESASDANDDAHDDTSDEPTSAARAAGATSLHDSLAADSAHAAASPAHARRALALKGPGAVRAAASDVSAAVAVVPVVLTLLRVAAGLLLKRAAKKAKQILRRQALKKLREARGKLRRMIKLLNQANEKLDGVPLSGPARGLLGKAISVLRRGYKVVVAVIAGTSAISQLRGFIKKLEWVADKLGAIAGLISDLLDAISGLLPFSAQEPQPERPGAEWSR